MTRRIDRAGFVLLGGASRCMGQDRALLPLGAVTMVKGIAAKVRAAAGNVTLIGSPEKYGHLGLPVVPGPLGGFYTALRRTEADWDVLVACDTTHVTAEGLDGDCVVPVAGKIPLCADYHRHLVTAAESPIHRKLFKMQDFVSTLRTSYWRVTDAWTLLNVNTPAEWSTR
jgi:molybdopterin-guanine dinucleotide biosynthesis protein A